jgi:hypothetical protein
MRYIKKFNEVIDSDVVDNYFANLADDGFIIRKMFDVNGQVTSITIFKKNGNFTLDEIIDDVKRFITFERQNRLRANIGGNNYMIRAADLDTHRNAYLKAFEISV